MGDETCRDEPPVTIPIRVRGMSSQNKFFDEQTATEWVGGKNVVCRLRSLVDLDTEIHLTNLQTKEGENFRVIWVNTQEANGFHQTGLELVNPEGRPWGMSFPTHASGEISAAPQAWLECQRCHQRLLTPVLEAQEEFLRKGFQVRKDCELCRATTPWAFISAPQMGAPASEAEPESAARTPKAPSAAGQKLGEDERYKGRAPLEMTIKVTRKEYGECVEDICQTVNVSRTGAYFLSSQNYEAGDLVEVVMNYKEGSLAIPLTARVVRQDQPKGTFLKGVAIHFEERLRTTFEPAPYRRRRSTV